MLYNHLTVSIRNPGKQIPDGSISLSVIGLLCFWDWFRFTVSYPQRLLRQIHNAGLSFFENSLPDMVPNAVHLVSKMCGVRILCILTSRRYLAIGVWQRCTGQRTETMKIIASLARDISLQAVVSSGFPIGTNSKPGGGVLSVVIYFW